MDPSAKLRKSRLGVLTTPDASYDPFDRLRDIPALVTRLTAEGLIGMRGAAAVYGPGRGGRPTHSATPTRHAQKGVRREDGTVVHLEAIKVAGTIKTSRQAVLRFFAALNSPINSPAEPQPKNAGNQPDSSAVLDQLLAPKRPSQPE